jgi:hypothetical protein
MFGRHVERFEVVPVVFEFGAVDDLVAHAGEDVFDPFTDVGERMAPARKGDAAWQGDVDGAGRRRRGRERRFARVECGFDFLLERVGLRAEHAPFVGRRGADGLEERRDLALLTAQVLVTNGLDGGDRGRRARAAWNSDRSWSGVTMITTSGVVFDA